MDKKAGTTSQEQPDDSKLDFITPLQGIKDTNTEHVDIEWTSGGLEAMNPKSMIKKIIVGEVTENEDPTMKEMFISMDNKNFKFFETDIEKTIYSFRTDSIQLLCSTGTFCDFSDIAQASLNNRIEHRIDLLKTKITDSNVHENCTIL